MRKRGQVTTFVILGVIIVALVLLLLYTKTNVFMFSPDIEDLSGQMSMVRKHIVTCIGKIGDEPIRRIALQGGYLSTPEGTHRLYDDTTISYLCYNMDQDPRCRNRMLRKVDMEEQLDKALNFELQKCIDVQQFKKLGGFEILTPKKWELKTTINPDAVLVKVDYPITIQSTKMDVEVSEDSFSKTFNYPLGALYEVSQDILDFETEYGEFEQLTYMLGTHGRIIIEKLRPYPDKIYKINQQDSNYVFQFAIQGEPL